MHVAMQGFRIVHDSRAHAFDRLPASAGGEFRRKVRTLSGNFQLVARCPALLLPWRNPLWFQFGSHKMARLAVPWAMLAMLTCAALGTGPFWRTALAAQATFYGLGLLAIAAGERVRGLPLAAPIASYLMLNAAAWMGFWVWASGRAARSWSRTAYSPPSAAAAAAAAPSASTPTTAN
jgi:hypothetical protein